MCYFKATIQKYWRGDYGEYESFRADSVEEICEKIYGYYEKSNQPNKEFSCRGKVPMLGGWFSVDNCLPARFGYYGSVWLKKIVYHDDNGKNIIMYLQNVYISQKTSEIFEKFRKEVKEKNVVAYGEF